MNPKKPWNVPPEEVIREALERPEIWEEIGGKTPWNVLSEKAIREALERPKIWEGTEEPSDKIDETRQRIADIIKDL